MNCFITHTPFTSTWLIPERNIEWAREVYGVEKKPVLIEEPPSWDSLSVRDYGRETDPAGGIMGK